jgi:ubiquinone/menaquinone biosynthesis C-methylase UbiE
MTWDHIKKANQKGWDGMSGSYQAETRISVDDVHYGPISPGEKELRLLGDVGGRRVLELACGAAQNAIALSKWGARVTAIDISPKQLQHARRLVTREGVGVALLRGDMESLGFVDGAFDIVLSSFGWEFAPDLAACLAECGRVLRDGGRLVVCTVHPLAAFEWDDVNLDLRVFNYLRPPVEVWPSGGPDGQSGMTFFHTVEEMFGLLTSSGFQIENILEPFPYPLPEMSEAELRAMPYTGPFWERQYERFSRVPFTIIYVARKSG